MSETMHERYGQRGLRVGLGLGIALLTALVACGGRTPSPPPPEPTPMDRDVYVIGVTDLLLINVWKNPELSVEVPVRADGMISVPLIDDVQAEGLTPQELKEVVTRELNEFVTAPDVTVLVRQMNSRFVSVIGEVGQSTRVPLTRDLRVLEAIALVGGFTTFADKSDVRIVRRQEGGGEVEYRFDYNAYVRGLAPGTNIVLRPGDTIIVPD
ncbi:MAG: polysaccharide biosynthesis/export family protein [Myxococcota bacterium]